MDINATIISFFEEKHMDGLTYDMNLWDSGYVNSLFALELVMFLEKQFHIRFRGRDMNREDFQTINKMSTLVERMQAKRGKQ